VSRETIERRPLIGGLLRLAWERVRQDIDTGVRAAGYGDLNPAHLAPFRSNGPDGQRPSRIAEQMGITKQSVNDLLRHLEHTGYLNLVPDPDDSRARLVRLTRRGRELHAVLWTHARGVEQRLREAIGREPFEQFKTTLRAISDNGLLVPPDAGDVPAASRRTHARRTPSRRAKR
jgi:DNA-binding MarR family transcriptional regulator